jgi:hypothetical protein
MVWEETPGRLTVLFPFLQLIHAKMADWWSTLQAGIRAFVTSSSEGNIVRVSTHLVELVDVINFPSSKNGPQNNLVPRLFSLALWSQKEYIYVYYWVTPSCFAREYISSWSWPNPEYPYPSLLCAPHEDLTYNALFFLNILFSRFRKRSLFSKPVQEWRELYWSRDTLSVQMRS